MDDLQLLCGSRDLVNGGLAVPFDVIYAGQTCRAFAIRFSDQAHAYLNRCTHVAMELDWQPDRIFDNSGQWLLCASHGAAYQLESGHCAGGSCKGGLVKIMLFERESVVYWRSAYNLKPVLF